MPAKIDLGRVNHLEPTPVESIGTRIGKIGVFLVYASRHEITVIDTSVKLRRYRGELCARTVMTISTNTVKRHGVNYRVMGYTRADRRYRGSGIAARVYEIVATKTGPIMSGSSQSVGGRAIWNTLVQRGRLTVAALWKGKHWSVEPTEFGEVDAEDFDVYNNCSRLIAV
jgi:hypothetical protein